MDQAQPETGDQALQPESENPTTQQPPQPWWQDVPLQAGGDVIIAQVSTGASNVAVGKNITQAVYSTLGAPQPNDKQVIDQQMAKLAAAIAKMQGDLDPLKAEMAEFQLKLLHGELAKTDEDETPSASTITQIGDWLLDTVPSVAETLASIFATPAVGRVVGKAGEIAVKWLRLRFGSRGTAHGPAHLPSANTPAGGTVSEA